MSPLRKEALQLVKSLPEKNLSREALLTKKQNAFKQLQQFVDSHNILVPPDFDYKKELAQYLEERLGHANFG